MLLPEKFSDYLSMFAIVISSTSLLISWLNYRRQGGLLKFDLDYEHNGGKGNFVLRIYNTGYHAVKISQIFMVVRSQRIPVEQVGFEVDYGQKEVVRISLAGYSDFHPMEVSRVEVFDIGREKPHRISTRSLRHKIRR
jgi:hypothetical protein